MDGKPEFEVVLATQTPAASFDDRSLPFSVVRAPTLFRLWRLIRSSDVIHIAGPSLAPLFLSWIARRPTVIEHHGYQAVCPNGLFVHQPDAAVCPGHFQAHRYGECLKCVAHESSKLRAAKSLLLMFPRYFLARRASASLVISKYILRRFEFPRSSVIYYGIEDPFRDLQAMSAEGPSTGRISFAYVGRLVSEKGIPVFLAAVGLLRNEGFSVDVSLIGDGPQRPELEAIIARNHLESCVQITGFLSGQALSEAVRGVRVVVMPSVWEETAGLAAIEQMMRGKLVIASDIGGLAEVLGQSGLKCAPGDAKSLAEAMRQVLHQPAIVDSLGRTARTRALANFHRDRMIAEHVRVYKALAGQHQE